MVRSRGGGGGGGGGGGCWGGGEGQLLLFLWSFLSVHINFQYKLNSHKRFFIVTVNLLSSVHFNLLYSFLFICNFAVFLYFLFINLMNINKRVLSLAVPSLVFNFNSRKSKQTVSSIVNTKSTSKINKLTD